MRQPEPWLAARLAVIAAVLVAGCVASRPTMEQSLLKEFTDARRVRRVPLDRAEPSTRAYVAEKEDGAAGYAVTIRVSGRSGPFTIAVVTDPDLLIRQVRVLSYPWQRGYQVRYPEFTDQFAGKGVAAPLRLGEDIDAATGATISSGAVAQGVRRALRLLEDRFAPTS